MKARGEVSDREGRTGREGPDSGLAASKTSMYMAVSSSRLPKEASISSVYVLPSAVETVPAAQGQIS